MRTERTTSEVFALLLLVLGAIAMTAVALRSGDDQVARVLACIAMGCLTRAAVLQLQRTRAGRG